MRKYFGTDGIRGAFDDFLTVDIARRCGNAVGASKLGARIVLGGDTRTTRNLITSAFSLGAMEAGAKIVDVGVCTTPGISFLTKKLRADFGVVVSASHNPPNYNGIKIFDYNGIKLSDEQEEKLESKFYNYVKLDGFSVGRFLQSEDLVKKYEDYLVKCSDTRFRGMKIVVDASNGAGYKIAPNVLRRLGAEVVEIHCMPEGKSINVGCGALHPESMCEATVRSGADMGIALDGDADRIIACDEKGNVIDGDMMIYMLAKYLKSEGKLIYDTLVGTKQTNKGLEEELKSLGIDLLRSDIGDKYVIEMIEKNGLNFGGEKVGHIIFRDLASTGDGILTAIKLCEMMKKEHKKLSELSQVKLYPQRNIDCLVRDKEKVMQNENLKMQIEYLTETLADMGRILVRPSGTEPKVRVMVECEEENLANFYAEQLATTVREIDCCLIDEEVQELK